MENSKANESKEKQFEYITALSWESAINILIKLCQDDDLAKRILDEAKAHLTDFDAESIADELFGCLNAIQIEDLWDNSEETRWGYREPTEVAFEMIEYELRPFIEEMHKYIALGMKKEEKEYCKGIIAGLLQYGAEGDNEFYDWASDDPYIHADNILYDWKKNNTPEDVAEVQAVYDGFFAE